MRIDGEPQDFRINASPRTVLHERWQVTQLIVLGLHEFTWAWLP